MDFIEKIYFDFPEVGSVPGGLIDSIAALVRILAWRRTGDIA